VGFLLGCSIYNDKCGSLLYPYIVSGRILKSGEARTQGVPMIEHAKRERKRKSRHESRGNECMGNKRR